MFKCRFVLKAKRMPGSEEWGEEEKNVRFLGFFFLKTSRKEMEERTCCVKVKGTQEVKTEELLRT